jgi:hypothetical protein
MGDLLGNRLRRFSGSVPREGGWAGGLSAAAGKAGKFGGRMIGLRGVGPRGGAAGGGWWLVGVALKGFGVWRTVAGADSLF